MNNVPFKKMIRAAAVSAAVASLVGISACAAPPTSTYTNAAGAKVTVNWKDYPAQAGHDAAEILSAPVKEKAEVVSADILADIRDTLGAEFGLQWAASGEAGWYPTQGNGYGGKAMTTTFNSVSWASDSAPAETSDWEQILAIITRATTARGLGSVKLSPNADTLTDDPAWRQELVEKYGTADLDKLYWWNGNAYGDSQWLSVHIVNVDRDTTGTAAKEEARQPRSISLSFGVTTLAEADRPAFMQALEPFFGLTPPEPTTSD